MLLSTVGVCVGKLEGDTFGDIEGDAVGEPVMFNTGALVGPAEGA